MKDPKELRGAAKITHGLKEYGHGSMTEGIKRYGDEKNREGQKDTSRMDVSSVIETLVDMFRNQRRK